MVICVTGPMAAGKNHISSILEKMTLDGKSFVSIDADLVCHEAVDDSAEKIIEAFGELAKKSGIPIADETGKIIRRNLGALIFGKPELVAKQESIVYPQITNKIKNYIEENKNSNVIVNATVLYKIPLMKEMDAVLFVDCPLPMRFLRARKRDSMKVAQIMARFRSQGGLYSAYKKTGIPVVKIWNCGSGDLQKKLLTIISSFR